MKATRKNRKTITESTAGSSIWGSWALSAGFRNWEAAAEALGVSVPTLARWRLRKPTRMQSLLMAAVYHRLNPWS